MPHLKSCALVLSAGMLALSFSASAVKLHVSEKISDRDLETLRTWRLPEVLAKTPDGQPDFDFHEADDPHNRALVDLIEYGMDIRVPNIRRQLAAEVQKLGDVCDLADIRLNVVIAPVPRLSNAQVGVKDPRRITNFTVAGCLKPVPDACRYNINDNNDTGLGFTDLKTFLDRCEVLTRSIIQDPDASQRYQRLSHPQDHTAGLDPPRPSK